MDTFLFIFILIFNNMSLLSSLEIIKGCFSLIKKKLQVIFIPQDKEGSANWVQLECFVLQNLGMDIDPASDSALSSIYYFVLNIPATFTWSRACYMNT